MLASQSYHLQHFSTILSTVSVYDVVNHLSTIEEQVSESMAWKSGSSLFEAIERNGGVPSCEEVSLPGGPGVMQTVPNDITHSPITHHGRAFSVNKCK